MKKDKKVKVEIDLTEHQFYVLAMMAHERDITFNQLVEQILKEYIDNNAK